MKTIDRPDFRGLTILCGSEAILRDPKAVKPLPPFDSTIAALLAAVSSELRRSPLAKKYPEVITFGFFCRKANITKLAERWASMIVGRVGRGVAFHIAPSNVPVNSAYTLVAGLLSGNACVVKASSKDFEQVRIICKAFEAALSTEKFSALAPYVNVVMYGRDRQDLTEWFSSQCNARIIWGGDETIRRIKEASIPPRATDVCFADRYSIGVMNAKAVLGYAKDEQAMSRLAHDFYNDTYLFDQNACTSQRLMIWHGSRSDCDNARDAFWKAVHDEIDDKYEVEPVVAVDKLMAVCRTSLAIEGSRLIGERDNLITRVEVPNLISDMPSFRAPGGLFQEYIVCKERIADAFAPLVDIIDERYQTIGYFGEDPHEIRDFVVDSGLHGIDRIVPIGQTADFDLIWDGYDLVSEMTRTIRAE